MAEINLAQPLLTSLAPYAGFAALAVVVVVLLADQLLRADTSRRRPAPVPVRVPSAEAARRVRTDEAAITQQLPVVRLAPAVRHAAPPLPPADYRRLPAPPVRPGSQRAHQPDAPAAPRSPARLMTPWGQLTRLPGETRPGIVPATLEETKLPTPGSAAGPVAPVDGQEGVLLGVGQVRVGPHRILD